MVAQMGHWSPWYKFTKENLNSKIAFLFPGQCQWTSACRAAITRTGCPCPSCPDIIRWPATNETLTVACPGRRTTRLHHWPLAHLDIYGHRCPPLRTAVRQLITPHIITTPRHRQSTVTIRITMLLTISTTWTLPTRQVRITTIALLHDWTFLHVYKLWFVFDVRTRSWKILNRLVRVKNKSVSYTFTAVILRNCII